MREVSRGLRSYETSSRQRALIFVRGGVAEVLHDADIDVVVIDYDNEAQASIPETHTDLLPREQP